MLSYIKNLFNINRNHEGEQLSEQIAELRTLLLDRSSNQPVHSIRSSSHTEQYESLKEIILSDSLSLKEIDLSKLNKTSLPGRVVSSVSSTSGFLSQVISASSQIGLLKVLTKGMYTTTASVAELKKYTDGTYSSMISAGGKIGKHVGFSPVNFSKLIGPAMLFQIATVITGQMHLKNIDKKLKSIDQKLQKLLDFHRYNRIAKLKTINRMLQDFDNRASFTIEDMITLNTFKFELEVIKEECLQYYEDAVEDAKEMIMSKRSAFSTFFENSAGKLETVVTEIRNTELFVYAELAVCAEQAYNNLLLVELKTNLKMKNPDENRFNKIMELKTNLENRAMTDVLDSVKDSLHMVSLQFDELVSEKQGNAIFKEDKIGVLSGEFKTMKSSLEEVIGGTQRNSNKALLMPFNKKFQITIDNTGDQEIIYLN